MEPIELDIIKGFLAEEGYEVSTAGDENVIRVKNLENGIVNNCVLQDNVMFFTVKCTDMKPEEITPELMKKMLDAENGITTSSFQLYHTDGRVAVTLNNFCKLQNMGAEDQDDILSCLGYLEADVIEAMELLAQ